MPVVTKKQAAKKKAAVRPPLAPGAKARKRYLKRLQKLKEDRSSWDSHWRDIAEQTDPRRSRFLVSDANKGTRKHTKIYNNTPIRAKAVLAAGMHSGLTNESTPWFTCVAPTPELGEVASVKEWLHTVEVRLRDIMVRSNIYNAYHLVYSDLGGPGTAAMYIEEDDEDVIRAWVFPIGSYCLVLDARGRVSGIYRETSMTVEQLVEQFGLEACSDAVQLLHKKEQLDDRVEVVHVIEKNAAYQEGKLGPTGKRWSSCWFEAVGNEQTGLLKESGYEEFPVQGPRWMVTGEDTYGSSPGMEALGDCRALQLYEKRQAQAFDKVVNPPMKGPSSLNGQKISLLPGDTTYTDSMSPSSSFSPAHDVDPAALPAFDTKIATVERHINSAFHSDLWLALTMKVGDMTAREVEERSGEKMQQLGPVTSRVLDELLEPSITRIFLIAFRRGDQFPPPPLELQGLEMKIEFTSMMARAAKLAQTVAVERLAGFVGNIAAAKPEVLDVVDFDQMVQSYAEMLGIQPGLIRTDEVIVKIRQAVADAKAKAAQQQEAMAAVAGAKTLGETDMQGDSALKRLMAGMGGVR